MHNRSSAVKVWPAYETQTPAMNPGARNLQRRLAALTRIGLLRAVTARGRETDCWTEHRPDLATPHDSRFTPSNSHAYTALRSAAMAS